MTTVTWGWWLFAVALAVGAGWLWHKRLSATPREDTAMESSFNPEDFIYIKIPGDIEPLDRGERFEDPIQAQLEAQGLGVISGGGSSLSDADASGRRRIEFCGIDVDTPHRDRTRAQLRGQLIELHAPVGTELHFTRAGERWLDRLTEHGWRQDLPRQEGHPGFDV